MIRPTTPSPPPPAATRPPTPPPPPPPRRSSIEDVSRLAFSLNRTGASHDRRAWRDPTTPAGLRAQDTFPRGAAITPPRREDEAGVADGPIGSPAEAWQSGRMHSP